MPDTKCAGSLAIITPGKWYRFHLATEGTTPLTTPCEMMVQEIGEHTAIRIRAADGSDCDLVLCEVEPGCIATGESIPSAVRRAIGAAHG